MAKVGKEVNRAEYNYAKEIMNFMSPTEFQNFKNSISGMANEFNVQINSLNEVDGDRLGKVYAVNYIEYQFLSTFENLTFLKNKIAETNFKLNIIEETIKRENPNSNRVIAEGKIGVYVFPGKEKLLKDKAKIIEEVFDRMHLGYLLAILFEIFFLISYTLIVTIGLWRSASNRDGWFWSSIVKIIIAGSILYYLYGALVSYNII